MAAKSKVSLLDCCVPNSTTSASLSTPAKAVKTSLQWAEKRNPFEGLAMVTDVENQKKPLVAPTEPRVLTADSVNELLKRDDDQGLLKLIREWSADHVWQPKSRGRAASTSLHVAAKSGDCPKCLRVLLDAKPPGRVLEAPDGEGRTPLLAAVEEGRPEAARMLLEAGAHVNARNEKGQGPLHLLVFAFARGAGDDAPWQEIAGLLLSHRDVDVETYAQLTPLGMAASRLPSDEGTPRGSSALVAFCRELVRAGASLEERADGGTVEEVLRRKKALPAVLMGVEGRLDPKRPTASEFLNLMLRRKTAEEMREFLGERPREEAQKAVNCRLGKRTVLFCAVDAKDESLVKFLLETGASPWSFEVTSELPIHRALSRGHLAILNLLIERMKGCERSVDLREYSFGLLQKVLESNRKTKETSDGVDHTACFQRLMQDDVIIDVQEERGGQTALHLAASFNNQDAIAELLRNGAFLGAHRVVQGNDWGNVLDSVLLPTLEKAMDGCIAYHPANKDDTQPKDALNEDYTLRLDYRFLVPPAAADDQKGKGKRNNEVETLMDISRNHRLRHAITHPLIQTLLYAKWRRALPLYLLNLGLYFFFVAIMTAFVYCLKDLRVLEAQAEKIVVSESNSTLDEEIESKEVTVNFLLAFLLPLTIYMIVRELFQIFQSREMYLKSIENYLECLLVITVIVLVVTRFNADITCHIAAWAMIVAWYEFVLILGRFPHLSIYITMLRQVSWNYLKVIILFSALILAFTISFNIILQPSSDSEDADFRNFWSMLPKAIVMSTGEFDYSDLTKYFTQKTIFLTSAVLIFLVFLFLIFLILMNVMNALAVKDTQEVIDDALMYSLTSRLELVYLSECLLLRCPGLQSHIDRLHLLSGAKYKPILFAKINKQVKKERLLYGKNDEYTSKLDDDTVECLRTHHLKSLEEEDPMDEIRSLLQELKNITKLHLEQQQ